MAMGHSAALSLKIHRTKQSTTLEVCSILSKWASIYKWKTGKQGHVPRRPNAPARQLPEKGLTLGPKAATFSPASKPHPPVPGPFTRVGETKAPEASGSVALPQSG